MKSTGEVMGVGETFAEAFLKSQLAAGREAARGGQCLHQRADADKPRAIELARILVELGFALVATRGTAAALAAAGVAVTPVNKVHEGRPHIVDMMKNDEIALVVNTVQEKRVGDPRQLPDPARGADRPDSDLHDAGGRARRGAGRRRHGRARSLLDPGIARASALPDAGQSTDAAVCADGSAKSIQVP